MSVTIRGIGVCLGISFAMAGCGGGGHSSPAPAVIPPAPVPINGRIMDGYINGARIYWDCNANHSFDSTEVSVISSTGGKYVIADKRADNCVLHAYVGVGAIDEDAPNRPISSPYTMVSIQDKPELISPFSTLVAGRLNSGDATSVSDADNAVAKLIGVSSSVLVDYKASNNQLMSQSAVFAASYVKDVPASADYFTSLRAVDQRFTSSLSTAGTKDFLSLSIQPYFYRNGGISRIYDQYNRASCKTRFLWGIFSPSKASWRAWAPISGMM